MTNGNFNKLLIYAYMSYECDESPINKFVDRLAIVNSVLMYISDCYANAAGDFYVDFARGWGSIDGFCDNHGFNAADNHGTCSVHLTYNFNMSRFYTSDHSIMSRTVLRRQSSVSV
jgi:hypothetical protein